MGLAQKIARQCKNRMSIIRCSRFNDHMSKSNEKCSQRVEYGGKRVSVCFCSSKPSEMPLIWHLADLADNNRPAAVRTPGSTAAQHSVE